MFTATAAGFAPRGYSGSPAEAYAAEAGRAFSAFSMGMPDFVLPSGLTRIEAEAFACSKASVVFIPDTVTYLGSRAFARCASLTQIRIIADRSDKAIKGC